MMLLHFGCRKRPGHFLTYPNGRTVRDFEADRLLVPHDHHLDGSSLFLPRPERVGTGALTYLPANDRTVLAWWDSTYDGRPNCNMALIADGRRTIDDIWGEFERQFADIAPEIQRPTLIERHDGSS